MPDTPRTLAELDALYADNNAGAISPQDLRDGFHSVVNPVAGGGFEGALYPLSNPDYTAYEYQSLWTDGGTYNNPQAIGPANTFLAVAFDDFVDPQGWKGVGSVQGGHLFGDPVFPTGSWVNLDDGLYWYQFLAEWDTLPATGYGQVHVQHIDPPDDLIYPNWANGPGIYGWKNFNFAQRRGSQEETFGFLRVSNGPKRMGMMIGQSAQASLGLWNAALHIIRVA